MMTDFAKKAKTKLIKDKNFITVHTLDFFWFVELSPISFFLCSLQPKETGKQEARIVGMPDQSHAHAGIRPHCKIGNSFFFWIQVKFCSTAVRCHVKGFLIGFMGGQVPGRQIVPRAELWRAIQVLSRVDETTNIQIPIDTKYVTKGSRSGRELEYGPNGGLLSIFLQLIGAQRQHRCHQG